MGDGRELERALVDVPGTGKTVPPCREKRFEKKFCKTRLNSPTVVKVLENKFGQVVEKSLESVLCLFGFVKAAEIQRFERIFGLHSKCLSKELPPLSNFLHKTKKKFSRARKSLGTSLALQCYAVLVSSGFLCSKVGEGRVRTTGDKGKRFVLFIPLFTLFLFSKSVYPLWLEVSFVVFRAYANLQCVTYFNRVYSKVDRNSFQSKFINRENVGDLRRTIDEG